MSSAYFYNTLTNRRELFAPQNPRRVTMYACGPTVYGPSHVGNARPAVVFDLAFRVLRRLYGESAVHYARNVTDIDDKIIAAAAEAGEAPATLAARWRDAYHDALRQLGALAPTYEPHATGHIEGMQAMINTLLEKGHAYAAEGHVLFDAASFSDYGALSNRRTEDMIAGARVEVAPYKKNPADFVLWKPSAADAPGWDSPWGRGRPGWHIECSAMAASCLGETIDLHGGGQDLIFPHHENEIAQSRCAHGAPLFARVWMHNGHVTMDGEKMSKSEGNTRLVADALNAFPGEAVRYALLSAHYRAPLHWNESLLRDAKSALDRLYRALGDGAAGEEAADAGGGEVFHALLEDLNTPRAFSLLHGLARKAGSSARARRMLLAGGRLMGFFGSAPADWFHSKAGASPASGVSSLSAADIELLIKKREEARARRDFAAADALRDELAAGGIALEDSPQGTSWRRT